MFNLCFYEPHVLPDSLDSFLDLLLPITIVHLHVISELLKAFFDSLEKVLVRLVLVLTLIVDLVKALKVDLVLLKQTLLLLLLPLLPKLLVLLLHRIVGVSLISLYSFVKKFLFSNLCLYLL